MSTDYAKRERAFLSQLKTDTGHTLEEWLTLIKAAHLTERNDIIDWLRQQGFSFSDASWVERIHHNGGQPIYADPTDDNKVAPVAREKPPASDIKNDKNPSLSVEAILKPMPREADPQTAQLDIPDVTTKTENASPVTQPGKDGCDADTLETALAGAKGLRPLAQHIVREMQNVAPHAHINNIKSALSFSIDGKAFAILTLAPKVLKLGLAHPGEVPAAPFKAPKFNPAPGLPTQAMTHMLELNDVRQFDSAVLAKLQEAAECA